MFKNFFNKKPETIILQPSQGIEGSLYHYAIILSFLKFVVCLGVIKHETQILIQYGF